MSRSLGVGGRLLSSLLSAYLDIWPDTHCKEEKSDDKKKILVKEKGVSKKNETGFGEYESSGKEFFGKKLEEQTNREKNDSGQTTSCETPAVGKIQCGRLAE